MSKIQTETSLLHISSIHPNPNNPRTIKDHKFYKLKKSIKDFPNMLELRPVVVDESMVILGGNMRYTACKDLGIKEIHVTKVIGLTEKQKQEFIIKDNQEYGDWDFDILANAFEVDMLLDWGFEPQELGIAATDPQFAAEEEASKESFQTEEDKYDDANVKMVNLFFTNETHQEFVRMVDFLRELHKTDTITDTVFKAIQYAYNNSETKI